MNRFQILTVVIGVLSLLVGGSLYLLYRPDTLVMFEVCKNLGIYDFIISLRPQDTINSWMVYSLPDGLWLLAYILLMAALWNFDVRKSLRASFPLAFIAIGSELLQIPHLIPGVFDWMDLLCYVMACIIGFIYITIINNHLNHK